MNEDFLTDTFNQILWLAIKRYLFESEYRASLKERGLRFSLDDKAYQLQITT